jgi:ABC-type Na+ efflux pump permease subunit
MFPITRKEWQGLSEIKPVPVILSLMLLSVMVYLVYDSFTIEKRGFYDVAITDSGSWLEESIKLNGVFEIGRGLDAKIDGLTVYLSETSKGSSLKRRLLEIESLYKKGWIERRASILGISPDSIDEPFLVELRYFSDYNITTKASFEIGGAARDANFDYINRDDVRVAVPFGASNFDVMEIEKREEDEKRREKEDFIFKEDQGIKPEIIASDVYSGEGALDVENITPLGTSEHLVLPLVFFLPILMGSGALASSIYEEKFQKKGEVLFTAPISPKRIVFEKILSNLIPMASILIVMLLIIEVPLLNKLQVAYSLFCVAFLMFGLNSLFPVISSDFKQMANISSIVHAVVFLFLIIPGLMARITPAAFVSPFSSIVFALSGDLVPTNILFFSSLIPLIFGLFSFYLAFVLFSGDMYDVFGVELLRLRMEGERRYLPFVVFSIAFSYPFLLMSQGIFMFLFFRTRIAVFMFILVMFEELQKALPLIFLQKYKKTDALFSGLTFFALEKGVLALLIGFDRVGLIGAILHPVFTYIVIEGLGKDEKRVIRNLLISTTLHTLWNLAVIS